MMPQTATWLPSVLVQKRVMQNFQPLQGKECQPPICSPQLTHATVRDGGASYVLTCLRCLPKVWELHCLHTATIQQYVFHLCRLKCFHRSDFPLGLLNFMCACHIDEKKLFPFRKLWHYLISFPEITKYTSTDEHTSILYHLSSISVKLVYQYKPPAINNRKRRRQRKREKGGKVAVSYYMLPSWILVRIQVYFSDTHANLELGIRTYRTPKTPDSSWGQIHFKRMPSGHSALKVGHTNQEWDYTLTWTSFQLWTTSVDLTKPAENIGTKLNEITCSIHSVTHTISNKNQQW